MTIIAIDGTAASGKGTLAKRLADHFAFSYMDTGLLYRAVGVITKDMGGNPENEQDAIKGAEKFISGYNQGVTHGLDLKSDEAGPLASKVGKFPKVRDLLLQMQRDFGQNAELGAILDGRDIGTVIFPEADVKLFITADVNVRAKRRWNELVSKGKDVTFESILQDMLERDERDMNRSVAPLVAAPDAIVLDTTNMTIDATVKEALALISSKL